MEHDRISTTEYSPSILCRAKQALNNRFGIAVSIKFNIAVWIVSVVLILPVEKSHALTTVDVLVLYENEVLNTRNGRDIHARIVSYISYANQAFLNSGVDMALRVVGIEEGNTRLLRVTSNNLDSLRSNSRIAELRRRTGADVVTLLNLRDEVRGGYVCGIGYLASGSSRTSSFGRGSDGYAYNLVGVDCGLSTFIHEIGHNMGLGHSQRQGSNGGVFAWARGYGVDGVFSTIMAYPQAFGTNNQLPTFSTPQKNECQRLPCGIDRASQNGADAAGSLTILASQIANFMPTVVAVSDDAAETESESGSGGSTSTDTPLCRDEPSQNNRIREADFNTLNIWQPAFGGAQLEVITQVQQSCLQRILVASNRSEYYHGVAQTLAQPLAQAGTITVTAKVAIRNAARANIYVALAKTQNGVTQYAYVGQVSATSGQFSTLATQTDLAAGGWDKIIIYGPPAGVDILLDHIALVSLADPAVSETPPDALLSEGFEGEVRGWASSYGGRLTLSSNAAAGKYSLLSSSRNSRFSGPSLDITGVLQPAVEYQIQVSSLLTSTQSSSDQFHVWLYYEDDQGGHWQSVIQSDQSVGTWQTNNASFSLPAVGEITRTRMHILGAQPETSIAIDNLLIE